MRRFVPLAVMVVAAASTPRASADPDATGDTPATPNTSPDPAASPAPAPAAANAQTSSFVLPKGQLLLDAFIEMSLSNNAVFEPVSLTPDLWYGVTDDLTLGLVHSSAGATGFLGAAGDSLCLTGTGDGCANFYQDVGIDARYRLQQPLAVDAGLYVRDTNPFQFAIKLGISGRWQWGKLMVEAQPNLYIGVSNREPTKMVGTMTVLDGPLNTEELYVPVTVGYLVMPKLELAFQAGLYLPFDDTSTLWAIPLTIAGRYAVSKKLGVGLYFSFPELIGGIGTGDVRTLTLGGTYAF
jgi:hypothetical protein